MAVDIRSPLCILGILLGIFSFGMLLPAFAEWAEDGQDGDMFLACFAVTMFAGGALMAAFRPREKVSIDIDTAVSGATSALGNVGPGVGEIIGPSGNFKSLPDGAKWLLSFSMLLGRLEMLTLLVLLMPSFWRA